MLSLHPSTSFSAFPSASFLRMLVSEEHWLLFWRIWFHSQHPHDNPQLSVTWVSGDLTLPETFSIGHRSGAQAYMQTKHIKKQKKKKNIVSLFLIYTLSMWLFFPPSPHFFPVHWFKVGLNANHCILSLKVMKFPFFPKSESSSLFPWALALNGPYSLGVGGPHPDWAGFFWGHLSYPSHISWDRAPSPSSMGWASCRAGPLLCKEKWDNNFSQNETFN